MGLRRVPVGARSGRNECHAETEAQRLQPFDVRSAAKPVPGVEYVLCVASDDVEVEGVMVDEEHDGIRGPALFGGRFHESDARVDLFAEHVGVGGADLGTHV